MSMSIYVKLKVTDSMEECHNWLNIYIKVVVLPGFCICNTVFVFQPFSTKFGIKVNNNMLKVYKSSKMEKYTFMLIYVNSKNFGDAKIMKKMPTFMHDADFRF